MLRHPLDPLDAAELARCVELVRQAIGDTRLQFEQVRLLEPEKSVVRGFAPGDPVDRKAFVSVLDRVAPRAKVYRKSGSWSTFHADVAMVQGPERNYIITALVNDPDGEQICRDLAGVLDSLLTE